MKKTGVGDTFLDRANSRLGDKVADGVQKLFPGARIRWASNIRIYVPIIRESFEAPQMIQIERNRRPVATIQLLNKVAAMITEESSRKEISDLIAWLNSLES